MDAARKTELDAMVAKVSAQKAAWLAVPLAERITLLEACRKGVAEVAKAWVDDGCALKGIDQGSNLAGEEWLAGPVVTMRNIRLLLETLQAGGSISLRESAPQKTDDGDKRVVRVFPRSLFDRLMFPGATADVVVEAGKPASAGRIYREKAEGEGKVCLVLGGGNVSSIPPMDVLYKLFAENEVVVLKTNPVNAHIGGKLEKAFAALVDRGFLAVTGGDAADGAYLAEHAGIDTLHVTGSDRTYDAIVWGGDEAERKERKSRGEPKNARPFSAELGCVTPVLVVPGPWSEGDLEFQARHVAAMVTNNASFNCNAAKVLVVSKYWLQRETFLRKVKEALARIPARKAYYPGAEARYDAFRSRYRTESVGAADDGQIPWTVLPDVPNVDGEYALTNEAFCGILGVVTLDAEGPAAFLDEATRFANDRCWGTLSAVVLVADATQRDFAVDLERALAALRYGAIGVNLWPGVIYGLASPPWGAYPGHPPEDIRSGSGFVHNTLLLDHPEKTIVRGAFRIRPTPPWFSDHKNLRVLGERLFAFENEPTFGHFVGVATAAMRG